MSHWKALGRTLIVGAAASVVTALNLGTAFAANYALSDQPLFLRGETPPLNMLVMSRDHRMYYEAYNDASDLDGDGQIDYKYITRADFKYYGYFSSDRCYTYSAGVFVPAAKTTTKKCAGGKAGGQWSGDWLNYVTMSRIDALRKVLYGGLRATDTATRTVLQRAFIPQDAHSWGKAYKDYATDGYYIYDYAPYDMPTGNTRHLFANTTPSGSAAAGNSTNPAVSSVGLPLLRVLENRNNQIWDWLSAERLVAHTNIHSGASQGGVTPQDLVVRVEVCSDSANDDENCKLYGSGHWKPTGLLQDYGENDKMMFGLLTGSYGRPHDGGVLRKAVASLKNEIDADDGTFKQLTPAGIINTIDRLRITGFNTDQYACGWITDSSDSQGRCSMWGNPTAEMMYEALRYFAGKTGPTPAFYNSAVNSEETTLGIGAATWSADTDPYKQFPYCAKPYLTVISDINPSYDSDTIPGSSFGGASDDLPNGVQASAKGQAIWSAEMGGAGRFFIGESGGSYDGAPTVKTVSSFGNIRGLAPEGPTKEGSYMAGSVAWYGRTNDVNAAPEEQKVNTFAVALASPLPKIEIPVGNGRITMVPFAKSVGGGYGINAGQSYYQPTNQIVDFYVETMSADGTHGKFRVNFEDVEQGADHDMDAIAIYEYTVNGGAVDITVTSEYAAGGIIQHMGYVISGTTADGTYLVVRDVDTAANADVDYFLDTPAGQPPGGNWNDGQALPAGTANPVTRKFFPGSTTGAGFLKDPLYYAAKWGGFKEPESGGNGRPDDVSEWSTKDPKHETPDNYFLVTSAIHLKDQLSEAFEEIGNQKGSSSSAAVSSGSISDDTHVFQAEFDPADWSGHLRSFGILKGGNGPDNIAGTADDVAEGTLSGIDWDAADKLKQLITGPTADSRNIFTPTSTIAAGYTGTFTNAVPFAWNSLSATQQAELRDAADTPYPQATQDRLNYLRGHQDKEGVDGFRVRTSILGDIVNSAPTFVAAPRLRIRDNLESKPYSGFRSSNANRRPMLYVGANDGMLHAFDASTGTATSGSEVFAFVPRSVFPNLKALSDPNYDHLYYVDGTPSVGDAYFGNNWHTILAGGLNKGGQGIYAIDVTNPAAIDTPAKAAAAFKWEFTDAEDADLGFTYSRPTIARLKDGRWYAIFGNGYNNTDDRGGIDTNVSSTGEAVLYIVDVDTGRLTKKIGTGAGMGPGHTYPNGLSTPAVVDLDGDSIADYAFAGDLYGNLWKFDLRSGSSTSWVVANGGEPLFKAVNSLGKAQPITTKPQVDTGRRGLGMIVLFGTGKFLEASDRVVANGTIQTFYGIYDANDGTVVERSQLTRQEVIGETSVMFNGRSVSARATSNNAVPESSKGWYIDLMPPAPRGFEGEMQVTDPVLRNGRVLFTTMIPDPDPCKAGGRSWLMELDEMTGARLAYSPFDFNNDKSFNASDYITIPGGDPMPASGFSNDAIMSRPAVIAGSDSDYAIITDTKSGDGDENTKRLNPGPGAFGRQSWRQLR